MAPTDQAPTSSYSDPIYDRLDLVAQAVRRHWLMLVLALLAAVVVAVVLRHVLSGNLDAAGAAAFVAAEQERDEAKQLAAYQAIADDQGASAYFRARAGVEAAQAKLLAGDAAGAKAIAQKAADQAKASGDQEAQVVARIALAAAEFQGGDAAAAEKLYGEAERAAGARFPADQIEATLGAARAIEAQGRIDDAILRLEPLTTRTDPGAQSVLDAARVRYWSLKRRQAEPAPTPAAATGAVVVPAPATAAAPAAATPAK